MTEPCPLCGTEVRVVGDTTKHYEPVEDWKAKAGRLESKLSLIKDGYKFLEADAYREHAELLAAREVVKAAKLCGYDHKCASIYGFDSLNKNIEAYEEIVQEKKE